MDNQFTISDTKFGTFGRGASFFPNPKKIELSPEEKVDRDLANLFNKYATSGPLMNKQEFKCAFIFQFGSKPSKDDIRVVK